MDYATPALFIGMGIGAAVMWGLTRWYYLRDGRARLADLRAKAKEAGVNI